MFAPPRSYLRQKVGDGQTASGSRYDPRMTVFDFIIVGQGLAGTCLAWELRALGARVMVVDREAAVTSSRIAAGLITPVTGQRLVKTWRWEELRASAWEFYHRMEIELGCSLLQDTSTLKVFASPPEREFFEKRWPSPDYRGLLKKVSKPSKGLSAPLGSCEILQGGQLDVAGFLLRSRARFLEEGCYRTGDLLLPGDLALGEEEPLASQPELRPPGGVVDIPRWGLRARAVVFCQGIDARSNPWFSNVEFNPARGEVLTVRIPDWTEDRIVHGGVWVAPLNPFRPSHQRQFFRVGATYDWTHLDSGPTTEGGTALEDSLEKLWQLPYEVVDHLTAVRPILKQLNPVVGLHPRYPQLGYMNGLGSKGSLQAPFFARQLASHLVLRTPLEREVDIQHRVPWPAGAS